MARNRTYGNLRKKIDGLNLSESQRENLLDLFGTMNRRYFQLEQSARRENRRTDITRFAGAKTAVTELVETFNGNNVLVSNTNK